MVAPLVMAAAAGAAMQYMNSEAARKASASERRRMDQLVSKLQLPEFDPTELSPEEYQLAATYMPEVAQYIEEKAPQVVQETADMATGRRAQRDALERLTQIGNNRGMDPALAAMANDASRKSQIDAQSRQRSILQDAERRGGLNSGSTLAAQLMGASEGMDRAAQTQNQLAIEAYRERLNALAQGADLGGRMRDQDVSLQGKNADIINAFNQRNAASRRSYLGDAANTRNEAQRLNIGNVQDIMNKNVTNRNAFNQYNQERGDKNAMNKFQAEASKIGLQTGQGAQNIAGIQSDAADRNQAIQGVGNIFQTYSANNAAENAAEEREDRLDRRAQYEKTGKWE